MWLQSMIGRPARSGGGGSPSHLSHHGFRADARSPITDTRLKREGGTFHFSLRRFRNSYLTLAVPTRVRLTLPHAIWLTSFAILSVSGGEQKGNPRWISIHTDRPLQMTSPHPLRSRHSDLGGVLQYPGTRGGVALGRAPPPAPIPLGFGNRTRTGGQDE